MIAARVRSPVLHLCGQTRRPELGQLLASAGVVVHEVECYRAIPAGTDLMRKAAHAADVLVVGSPLVATELAQATANQPRPDIVALGPTTAAACAQVGWPPTAIAATPDAIGVADAIRAVLARREPE
jgi:uroporphyrinogen-III synthase